MSIKTLGAKVFANVVVKKMQHWIDHPIETQQKVFTELISKAKNTAFGKDHKFDQIHSHQDFVDRVPIRDYEEIKPYIDRIIAEEKDVLWPGQPLRSEERRVGHAGASAEERREGEEKRK